MKRTAIMLLLLMTAAAVALAVPFVPKLGMQAELRGGGYMTVSPKDARGMFGNGILIGGSLRKSILPMLKIGISIDRITLNNNDAVQYADLSPEMQDVVGLIPEGVDIEMNTTPICLEAMFEPPVIPLYFHAGYGIYKTSVTAKYEGVTYYDKKESKWGGFIGAGAKLGLPMMPISFRAGAKYHIMKVDDDAMGDPVKAVSLEAAVRLNF